MAHLRAVGTQAGLECSQLINNPLSLLPYSLLAIFMIMLAALYVRVFYGLTHLFKQWKLRAHFKPAIGAFLSCLVGLGLYYLLREILLKVVFG